MKTYKSISYKYPELNIWIDYSIIDNWDWPHIEWYNKEIAQPTQAELESAWVGCEKEMAITEKVKRMDEINKELLNLWGSNALVSYEALDTIRDNKISALTIEFNILKTDLTDNYEDSLVNDILTSLFS